MDCNVGLCHPRNDGKKKKGKSDLKEKEGQTQKKKGMDCHVGLHPPRNDGELKKAVKRNDGKKETVNPKEKERAGRNKSKTKIRRILYVELCKLCNNF